MQSRAGVAMAQPFLQPRDWGAVLVEFGLCEVFQSTPACSNIRFTDGSPDFLSCLSQILEK